MVDFDGFDLRPFPKYIVDLLDMNITMGTHNLHFLGVITHILGA